MSQITIGGKPYQPQYVIALAKKGCGWFAAIAAFSLVNSLLVLFGAKITFVIGLGATQVVDGILMAAREQSGGSLTIAASLVGFAINLLIIGVYVLLWRLSRRGNPVAYAIGMVFYLLDSLIFLLVKDFMGVAFHIFFLAMLWKGYAFVKQWTQAQRLLSPSTAPEAPQPDFA